MVNSVKILVKHVVCFANAKNVCCMHSSRFSLKEAGEPLHPVAPQLEEAERAIVPATMPPKVICQLLIVLEAHRQGRPTSSNEASLSKL